MTKKKKHTKLFGSNPIPWVIGMLVILCLAVVGGIYWHQTNKVMQVQIRGSLTYINKKNLKKHIDVPVGLDADSLNYQAIRRQIKKVPNVRAVRFHLSAGGTLTINITERTPIALLVDGSKRAYIGKTGVRLKKRPGQSVNVPILYGFPITSEPDTIKTKAFKKTIHFLQILHQNEAANATISEVVWNAKNGVIALTNNNGVKIIFGKNNFHKKLRNYNAFFRSVVRKEGINQFHSIDLRFKGQIVTRED